jgi:hypothetical protein
MTVGSGSNEPMGIVTAAVAAGNVTTFATGNTATIGYTDLVNVEHSVDPSYRYNASSYWMFSDAVLKVLKKLLDGQNRPLWQPGLSASFREGAGYQAGQDGQSPAGGMRPTVLDHPYALGGRCGCTGHRE